MMKDKSKTKKPLFPRDTSSVPPETKRDAEAYEKYLEWNNAQSGAQRLPERPARFLLMLAGHGDRRSTLRSIKAQQARLLGDERDYDYAMYIFCGDELAPDALMELACAAESEPAIIYADEDMSCSGHRTAPFFKPELRVPTLISYNMCGRAFAIRRDIFERCNTTTPEDDDDIYGLVLRAAALAEDYVHISRPIYTCGTPNGVSDAAISHIDGFLSGSGHAVPGLYPGSFRSISAKNTDELRACIVVPHKDELDALRRLLESVEANTLHENYSFVISDAGSKNPAVLRYYQLLEKNRAARIIRCGPRSLPMLLNEGAKRTEADVLVFLDPFCEAIRPTWLTALLNALCLGAEIAGGKLIDPSGTLLFAGGVVGIKGWADSPYRRWPDGIKDGRQNRLANTARQVSYVSSACMAMRTQDFFGAGCFDETFSGGYGMDAELCLREAFHGGVTLYEPAAVLRCHKPPMTAAHAGEDELARCYDVMRKTLTEGDPHYSSNFDYGLLRPQPAPPAAPIALNPIYTGRSTK